MATFLLGAPSVDPFIISDVIDSSRSEEILNALRLSPESGFAFRSLAMQMLDGLPSYNWSGIYRLEPDGLYLDAYVGAATDHTHIPVGRGVCGTAVSENRNQVVADVRELDNYLACSLSTRAEIVVLIRKGGAILGQIDIDGHEVNAFDRSDEEFLEKVAALIADRWD